MATTKQLLIQFSDDAVPPTWSHSCTINTSREFTLEATTNDGTESDCSDPDKPSWVLRAVDTLSAGINGAGTMDPVSYGVLRDKMLSGEEFAVRVTLAGLTALLGGGHYAGKYVMTNLGLAKEGKGFVTSTVALASSGVITWVPAT